MSLLDNLASPDYRPPRGPECGLGIVLEQLDDKTRKTLQAALDNPHAPSTKISVALGNSGTAPQAMWCSGIVAANVGAQDREP